MLKIITFFNPKWFTEDSELKLFLVLKVIIDNILFIQIGVKTD